MNESDGLAMVIWGEETVGVVSVDPAQHCLPVLDNCYGLHTLPQTNVSEN